MIYKFCYVLFLLILQAVSGTPIRRVPIRISGGLLQIQYGIPAINLPSQWWIIDSALTSSFVLNGSIAQILVQNQNHTVHHLQSSVQLISYVDGISLRLASSLGNSQLMGANMSVPWTTGSNSGPASGLLVASHGFTVPAGAYTLKQYEQVLGVIGLGGSSVGLYGFPQAGFLPGIYANDTLAQLVRDEQIASEYSQLSEPVRQAIRQVRYISLSLSAAATGCGTLPAGSVQAALPCAPFAASWAGDMGFTSTMPAGDWVWSQGDATITTDAAGQSRGGWEFPLYDATFCGKPLAAGLTNVAPALIDTGGACLSLPAEMVAMLSAWLPLEKHFEGYTLRLAPGADLAAALPELTFKLTVGGPTFTLALADLLIPGDDGGPPRLCVISGSGIQESSFGATVPYPARILLGSMAMAAISRRAYAHGGIVLDMTSRRIALPRAAAVDSPATSAGLCIASPACPVGTVATVSGPTCVAVECTGYDVLSSGSPCSMASFPVVATVVTTLVVLLLTTLACQQASAIRKLRTASSPACTSPSPLHAAPGHSAEPSSPQAQAAAAVRLHTLLSAVGRLRSAEAMRNAESQLFPALAGSAAAAYASQVLLRGARQLADDPER